MGCVSSKYLIQTLYSDIGVMAECLMQARFKKEIRALQLYLNTDLIESVNTAYYKNEMVTR